MALELDPILEAAQDAQSRHPLAEIVSTSMVADIPFDGQLLTSETTDEQAPGAITLSSGRLVVVYRLGTRYIQYTYTDTERTEFGRVVLDAGAGASVIEACPVELEDGNVGIVWTETYGGQYRLRQMTVSPVGAILVAAATIATSATWTSSPSVIALSGGGYLLVYGRWTGAIYGLKARTSADFVTWSTPETALSIAGLSTATPHRWDHPCLLQVTTPGQVFLAWDYVESVSGDSELTNVYWSTSDDGGSTWAAATALTTYSDYSAIGLHPSVAQPAINQLDLAWYESVSRLWMDEETSGWCVGHYTAYEDAVRAMHFDSASRSLYIKCAASNVSLGNILKINVDNWTVTQCWSDLTTPGYSALFEEDWPSSMMKPENFHGAGPWDCSGIVNSSGGGNGTSVFLLNGDEDWIREYFFKDIEAHGKTMNVSGLTWYTIGDYQFMGLSHGMVDAVNGRLWLCFHYSSSAHRYIQVGYIELDDAGPTYTFHQVVLDINGVLEENLIELTSYGDFLVVPERGWIVVAMGHAYNSTFKGRLRIYNITDGTLLYDFYVDETTSFHRLGTRNVSYYNGKLYCVVEYTASYGQEDRRGLMIVDPVAGSVTYSRPTEPWPSVNDYQLRQMTWTDDGLMIVASEEYGVGVFNPNGNVWEKLIDKNELPGLIPRGGSSPDAFYCVAYDPAEDMILAGVRGPEAPTGLAMFSRYGRLKISYLQRGNFTTDWAFLDPERLIQGNLDYEASVTEDPDGAMYAFWTSQEEELLSGKWDKEGAVLNLSNFLTGQIQLKRSIDGTPSSLSFAVSHGHLFDPNNLSSLLSIYLRKGRVVQLRFGERVGGADYWQLQGLFLVQQIKLAFERGTYPVMQVQAEDQMSLWEDMEIIATDSYEEYPEDLLTDLLTDAGYPLQLDPADVIWPVFDNRYIIQHQWLDTDIQEIVKQVCDRFGYYPRIDVNGDVTARKIAEDNPVDHAYSDLTKIKTFTPDTSFSSFVNRVTVTGYEAGWTEVIYPEERVGEVNGTVGWWSGDVTHKVYYRSDKGKQCLDPRVVEKATVRSIGFYLLGQVSEEISEIDPNNTYVEITITVPDTGKDILLWQLFPFGLGSWLLINAHLGDLAPPFGGFTVPVGTLLVAMSISTCLIVLSSVCNYMYEVFARPVGKIQREIQATADDLDAQAELGRVVPKKIEDDLCVEVGHCQQVAAFELMVARLQRNRVQFSKIADLRDEDGDTLQIPHPYGGQTMTIFVTDLTRTYNPPARPGETGDFTDTIEGWTLA